MDLLIKIKDNFIDISNKRFIRNLKIWVILRFMILCKIIRKDLNILGEIKFSELLLIFKPLGILIKYQYKKYPNTIFPLLNICYLWFT